MASEHGIGAGDWMDGGKAQSRSERASPALPRKDAQASLAFASVTTTETGGEGKVNHDTQG
jgi:hypothetical protein